MTAKTSHQDAEPPGMLERYAISNADEVASPAVLLYPALIAQNLQGMVTIAGGPQRLRPHVKTHKLPQVIALKRAAGIRKFKVATIAEAEMTAASGGEDVLLACQPVGPQIARLLVLMRAYPGTQFSTLVDDPYNLAGMAAAARDARLEIPLYLDLDVGMRRTGIAPGDGATALYRAICRSQGVRAAGLHAYDGHLRAADLQTLGPLAEQCFDPVWRLREQLRRDSFVVPAVVAGGTPTMALLARHADVELGAGTTVLWDTGQAQVCEGVRFVPAAIVLTRVISKPAPDLLCLDLGHKALASEMPHPRVQIFGLDDAVAVTHSEEHLVLHTARAASYRVGDVLYGVPRHVCPTMALHSEVWAVRGGVAAQRWPVVARTRRLSV
jgi:D-serine deaminase-like pyridoxal phosphate-dependent protein